jgi:phosphoglycerol transferase MdoB-like AlkP superfamily enzyme
MAIWVRRFFWLIVAYTIQRVLFYLFNAQGFIGIPNRTLSLAFLDGIRFDLCAIATINTPIIVIHSFRNTSWLKHGTTKAKKYLDGFVGALFMLVNIPFIVFGIVDSRLFSFTGRRISPETFAIAGDIKGQSYGILMQYWHLTVPGLMLIAAFAWITWQRETGEFSTPHSTKASKSKVIKWFAIMIAAFLAIRGGLQTKPLAPAHAYRWQPVALANFVLNSAITTLRTPSSATIKRRLDFPSMAEVRKQLGDRLYDTETVPLAHGKNFVVIIVESLATEYVGFFNEGQGYTPFLDSLIPNAVTFTNSFANGRRSIDAMPAIFAGVPAWREQPFITSPYATNVVYPLPRMLASAGYHSLFFHGAANGSMHFDIFARIAGFDEYIGRHEYPYQGDDDGQWGIYDEPFLKFAIEKFSTTKEPFLGSIFTLSSHNPFKIPPSQQGQFPKGSLPIHESIGYADKSLRTFFKLASAEPWFHNTIFVITGDHTSLSDNPAYNNMPGRFRVPIIFFDPTGSLPRVESDKVATHVDITPTILELAGLRPPVRNLFGGPLFDRNWSGRFIQEEYETWYYRDRDLQLKIDERERPFSYPLDDDGWKKPEPLPGEGPVYERLKYLQAARQYYTNGLLDNTWQKN